MTNDLGDVAVPIDVCRPLECHRTVLDITIKNICSISSLFCTSAPALSLAIHLCPIYNQDLLSVTSLNGVLVPSHPDQPARHGRYARLYLDPERRCGHVPVLRVPRTQPEPVTANNNAFVATFKDFLTGRGLTRTIGLELLSHTT